MNSKTSDARSGPIKRGPRLLALSAGGDRGAVLVGMLHGLYRVEGRDRVDWHQIAGIMKNILYFMYTNHVNLVSGHNEIAGI